MIHGTVEPGFEAVRDEFARNFAERGELGAACAAYHRGRKVVDLWGGLRDGRRGLPWEEDTLVLVYSTSKGLAAMTLALAHSRGWLEYDERVAAYWPEFGESGKETITVRQLLDHEAGLPVIDEPLDERTIADADALAGAVARQRPLWPPGTRHGYHGVSLGWFEGELLRRVDPRRRTLGRVFAEELAGPLNLDFHFGLPEAVADSRVARVERLSRLRALPKLRHLPAPTVLGFMRPRSLTARAFANPRLRSLAELDSPRYRPLEFPAGGGIGRVLSIARAYAEFAAGGPALGLRPETMKDIEQPAQPPPYGWRDAVLKVDTAYRLGWVKPAPGFRFGSSDRAYGHPGAGGSFAFADPDRKVGFAYAMNRLGFRLNNDPREKPLRDALYRCIDSAPSGGSVTPGPRGEPT